MSFPVPFFLVVLYDSVMPAISILVPQFDLGAVPLRLGVWHMRGGQLVSEGDRLVEIVAPDIVIEISSPADGVLRKIAAEDDEVFVGQIIGEIV